MRKKEKLTKKGTDNGRPTLENTFRQHRRKSADTSPWTAIKGRPTAEQHGRTTADEEPIPRPEYHRDESWGSRPVSHGIVPTGVAQASGGAGAFKLIWDECKLIEPAHIDCSDWVHIYTGVDVNQQNHRQALGCMHAYIGADMSRQSQTIYKKCAYHLLYAWSMLIL